MKFKFKQVDSSAAVYFLNATLHGSCFKLPESSRVQVFSTTNNRAEFTYGADNITSLSPALLHSALSPSTYIRRVRRAISLVDR